MNRGLTSFRALAFFAILLFHIDPGSGHLGLQVGYLGVQAFFVLSGFLLTPILLDMKANLNGTDFFVHFYGRRALRIFPLYYLYLAIIAVISFWVLSYEHIRIIPLARFVEQLPWTVTYTYDFYHATNHFEHTLFATHFWSLAVEEQFYLVWPLAIFFIPARLLKKFLLGVILAAPLLRFLTAMIFNAHIFLPANNLTDLAIYVLPFSHVDAFAIGGFMALYGKSRPAYLVWLYILFVLLLGIVTAWLTTGKFKWDEFGYAPFMKDSYKYVWGYTLVNLMFAHVLVNVRSGTFLPELFENRQLAYLGTISYGLYVFHFPVCWLVYSRMYNVPVIEQQFAILFITVLISMASYEFMEKRMIRLKDRYFARRSAGNIASAPMQI